MRFAFRYFPVLLVTGLILLVSAVQGQAQQSEIASVSSPLPDSPRAQMMAADSSSQQDSSSAQANEQSSGASTTTGTTAQKSKHDVAEDQLHEQTHQRLFGIIPSFGTSYRSDAVSLTGTQKIKLAARSAIDPIAFVEAGLIGGLHETGGSYPEFGWGAQGYGKRVGAAYLDSLDATMIGNGFLPALLHQDPRYFRLGHGTFVHRTLYSLASAVICKHDNTGKWEPNYSNIGGNLAAGALSKLYYPPQHAGDSSAGAGVTISNALIVTAEGSLGSVFQEFWPDISRKFFHKDPTGGRDAEARAQNAAEEQARREKKEQAKQLKKQSVQDQQK